MDTDRAAADLVAVEHDVVRLGLDLFDGGAVGRIELAHVLVFGRCERVVQGDEPLVFLIVFKTREVDDPDERQFLVRRHLQVAEHLLA